MNTQPKPKNYTEAADILGSYSARKIAHNTKLERLDAERLDAERIGVRLHSTVVVEFRSDGTTRLDSNGFRTATTKERLNRYIPAGYKIRQVRDTWFVYFLGERMGPFEDGLRIWTAAPACAPAPTAGSLVWFRPSASDLRARFGLDAVAAVVLGPVPRDEADPEVGPMLRLSVGEVIDAFLEEVEPRGERPDRSCDADCTRRLHPMAECDCSRSEEQRD
jgi:hypothetical protein